MSLDARLKQGLSNLADPIDVDYELGLVRVTAVARQRERRNVMIAAFAGAAAAIALLAGGGKLADMVLGIEAPLPPAEERIEDDRGIDESRFDENGDGNRVVQDDDLRLDEALDQTDPAPIDGGRIDVAGRSNGSSAYVPPSNDSGDDPPPGHEEDDPPVSREPRTDTGEYQGYAVPVGGGQSACDQEGAQQSGPGCVIFQTEPGERTVEISIEDDAGGTVAAWVQIDRDGDGGVDGEWTAICDESTRPISIPTSGDAVVYVEINGGACTDGTDSNPVAGTVTAVFAT